MISKNLSIAALCAALLVFGSAPAVAQNFPGAIFTSTGSGTTVNANLYASKDLVYLNGGPQNLNAQGLPNGTYVFQVTDPSGSTLLSSDDPGCRLLSVSNGVVHGSTTDVSLTCGTFPHANGSPNVSNGSIPVQLIPYADTPNGGGVYKAWLTPLGSYDTTAGNVTGEHFGFSDNQSKTDNFRINQPVSCVVTNTCPPPPATVITGIKFYDTNGNGSLDPGELGIAGWEITAAGSLVISTTPTFTDNAGVYNFVVGFNSGTYTITEIFPTPALTGPQWVPTTLTSGTVPSDSDFETGPSFGNVCRGTPTNGLTLGYWSNKNGQASMTNGPGGMSAALALLTSLNLVSGDGIAFNPTSYTQFRNWILSATATNMAYMLSAQLAAMELNVYEGFVTGSELALVTDPTLLGNSTFLTFANPANPAGDVYISITKLMKAADAELGAAPKTIAAGPDRTYEGALKTLLDNLNNNLTPVILGQGSCTIVYPI